MLRVLVSGGRNFSDMVMIHNVLDKINKNFGINTVIHGACPTGADHYADTWAALNDVNVEKYEADWKRHGKSAGPKRNAKMVNESNPDIVIVFPGGRGTEDLKTKALDAGWCAIVFNELGEMSHEQRILSREIFDL
jgi:hypothetical protein